MCGPKVDRSTQLTVIVYASAWSATSGPKAGAEQRKNRILLQVKVQNYSNIVVK